MSNGYTRQQNSGKAKSLCSCPPIMNGGQQSKGHHGNRAHAPNNASNMPRGARYKNAIKNP